MGMEAAQPSTVYQKTLFPSPGGGKDRGPWGPNAIQYAALGIEVSLDFRQQSHIADEGGERWSRNGWI